MNLTKRIAVSVLALGMMATTGATFAQGYPPPPPPPQYGPWATPPAEYDAYHQQGFRDGIDGARKDFENHRPFTPENRDEYRHPHVPRNVYHDYREAFREGYHRAVVNMGYGRPGPGPR